MNEFLEIVQKTLLVSGFVLLLMILIEYLNVRTTGNWNKGILKNKWIQVIIAVLLGLSPGCAGAFAVVSLYTHKLISFAALLAVSVATFGDEAFVIFATNPDTGINLVISLLVLSILLTIPFMFINIQTGSQSYLHLQIHQDECCSINVKEIKHQLRKITFQRALLLGVLLLVALNMFLLPHGHEDHHHGNHLSPESIVFIILLAINLFVIITVPEHFLTEHIWDHVIKKHFVRLFIWTLSTIVIVHFLEKYISIDSFARENKWWLFLMAIVIGILPISGPHLIFFTLFMEGYIPFSILLTNSIVQEGHAGIPLLAEDKKAFLYIKAIKIAVAGVVGASMLHVNWL